MTYRDDDQSTSPNPPHAMIGGPQPHDALMVPTNGQASQHALALPSNIASPAQDVLRGGMDVNWFFHCMRRRLILAVGMGLVVAVASAIALWFIFPESSSAVALFQVESKEPTLIDFTHVSDMRDFDILQKTQLALLKSNYVLQAALRGPGISTLSALAGESDPVQWLTDKLNVTFQQSSEILSITLSGDEDPEDLRKLVDAVASAYQNTVVFDKDQERLVTRDALARSMSKISAEIQSKMEEFLAMAKELGVSEAFDGQRDPESDMLMREVTDAMHAKSDLEARIIQTQTDFAVIQQQYKDPQMIQMQVDEQLKTDPNMSILNQSLMQAQYSLSTQQSAMKNGKSREADRLQKQITGIQKQISDYRNQQIAQMSGQQKNTPNLQLQSATKIYQIQLGMLAQQRATLDKQIQDLSEQLLKKAGKSVELDVRRADLDRLQEIAKDMGVKLQTLDIEAEAPKRIKLIQPATLTPSINKLLRYAIVGLGFCGGFALTCFGIAYLEFRSRRLNGPDQVDEGLGIRVVGTLPALSARKMLDPNHPVIAQLTESIDSVRTQLMHDSTSKRRQVVLVTSASTMEGRTTVASQLAASLARAGRRTLLVDGDVRRPALNSLFDVPLEDGLCEVLRAEVDVADVIRPTHAEGLWLLTAGYCDVDAIHALATEQMQPVFEKLRTEYDFIIIDGAPVIGMSDALIFGQYCDGAILSVRRDYSQMHKINEAAALLRSVGIRLIGSVVNGVRTKSDDRVTQLRLIAPKSERQLQSA
jgi:succinoglycan biosynthesis transport protein ExoP